MDVCAHSTGHCFVTTCRARATLLAGAGALALSAFGAAPAGADETCISPYMPNVPDQRP
jgi:hypothetical protein